MLALRSVVIANGAFRLDADFTLPRGAKAAVLGPSGAGKSTLLHGIAGFLPLLQGQILWDGADISALPPGKRPLSIVFQDHNLFPHLTAAQNVGLGIGPSLRLDAHARARVEETLARVGLGGLGGRLPQALSGGQQGRVALARALVRGRPLLLLDEPFAALGPALKAELLDLVAGICAQEGLTLMMISHDPNDAARIADLAIVVAEGRAAPPRPTPALLADPPPALRAYLGDAVPGGPAGRGDAGDPGARGGTAPGQEGT